jgi:hypothetical protein
VNNEGTLNDLYLEWLYKNFIGAVSNPNPKRTHWKLAKQLYKTRFTWCVQNDGNRAEDGKALRHEFINENNVEDIEVNWLQEDCSVLEMLIGLACRASFESMGVPGDWFWKLLSNLEIQSYNDRVYSPIIMEEVDTVITRLLDRNYEQDGVGGLFPMHNARQDQRQVELWSQLQEYVLEGDFLEHGP